ncbi:MAG: IclR family transcriptional regulator [Rhodobacteraceae bacterium]|nr:IclR family transcriptional regulator [Paracoccaceae bacterium]
MRTTTPRDTEPKARSEGPMVLSRVFALLRLLAENKRGMTLSEIAVQTSVPKSSLSATLKALDEQGLLVRDGRNYSLGSEAYAIASLIMAGSTLSRVAHHTLVETMEETGETVLLATLDRDEDYLVYMDIVETPNPIRYSVSIGTRRPLYPSAAGRVLLAYQRPEEIKAYLDRVKLERFTEHTVIDKDEIEKALTAVRESGLSMSTGEFSADSSGFAAPVFNHSGAVIAALTVALPTNRAVIKREHLIEQVRSGAAKLSRIVGHTGGRAAR